MLNIVLLKNRIMESRSIVWKVKGEVTDPQGFESIVKEIAEKSHAQSGTKLYWWTISSDGKIYCDFDCYEDEKSAFDHLIVWGEYAERFSKVATIDKFIVLGDVSDELKEQFNGLPMYILPYYGGFRKDAPASKMSESSDIIWTMKGKVKDWDKFQEAMDLLTKTTEDEEGALMHWWCADKESGIFHVFERYSDEEAVMKYLDKTWREYGKLFKEATDIDKYITFNTMSSELLEAVSSLKPIQMNYFVGFGR